MKIKEITHYINVWSIFILALTIRLLLSPENHVDEQRYLLLSDQIVAGNFDLDAGSFICAPFTPYFIAGLKLLLPNSWYVLLFVLQAFISALCVFSLYQISLLLFNNNRAALLGALIYAVYPDTFMYVRMVGQEVFFQAFLIFSVHFLLKYIANKKNHDIFLSAIFFSFCFLTKSFILFWSPFIVLYLFLHKTLSLKNKIIASSIYTLTCVVFTMPFGFYNLSKHNQYLLSSNGGSVMFWVGSSEYAYTVGILKKSYETELPEQALVDTAYQIYSIAPPSTNIEKYFKLRNSWGSPSEIQNKFWRASVQWVKANPIKFLKLHCYYAFRFIFPGHKTPNTPTYLLIIIFLYSALLYFGAFLGLKHALKLDFQKHNWLLTLWLTMLLFSTIFAIQVRFRVITIDSFCCLYAAFFIREFLKKYHNSFLLSLFKTQ